MRTVDEQICAHEAGHAVIGMAVGMQLQSIQAINSRPLDSYLSDSIGRALVTIFSTPIEDIEERLRHLVMAAGMAGEAIFSGKRYEEIGKDDLVRLGNAGLSENQIKKLIAFGADDVLYPNHALFEDIWNSELDALEHDQLILIHGAPVNAHFALRGKRFAGFDKLDQILSTK
jgi:hypothetical protein